MEHGSANSTMTDMHRLIFDTLEVIFGRVSQFHYQNNEGSCIVVEKVITIRIWPREVPGECDHLELHILPTDDLTSYDVASPEDLRPPL